MSILSKASSFNDRRVSVGRIIPLGEFAFVNALCGEADARQNSQVDSPSLEGSTCKKGQDFRRHCAKPPPDDSQFCN